jgi:hypothetical protein
MFERRVVRGNTHGNYVLSKEDEYLYKLNSKASVKQPAVRRPVARSAAEALQPQDLEKSGSWTDKRTNKVSVACFTEKQLIFETDLPPCHDATTQTEFVIPKEIPDLTYIKEVKDREIKEEKKKHKETQIYPDEPPFDFNYEAEPIVQVLMTRILEESRVEVLEEEELAAMKLRQQHLLDHKAEVKRKLEQLEQKERDLVKANVDFSNVASQENRRTSAPQEDDQHAPTFGQSCLFQKLPEGCPS